MHRPKVPDTFRDDIQLDFTRFVLWSVMLFVKPKHWLQIAQGGFGTVYKVTDVSPPIAVSGTFYQTVAIKILNSADAVEELKAEVESLSVLTHGALQLCCCVFVCCCVFAHLCVQISNWIECMRQKTWSRFWGCRKARILATLLRHAG